MDVDTRHEEQFTELGYIVLYRENNKGRQNCINFILCRFDCRVWLKGVISGIVTQKLHEQISNALMPLKMIGSVSSNVVTGVTRLC